jgi:GNAT superfamily N-acetyltransferase
VIEIRQIESRDSLEALTSLLHSAYAELGAMGLNYTAVDQSVSVTRKRINGGICFVAVDGADLVGTIVVEAPNVNHSCVHFARPGVASAHQFAVAPSLQRRGIGSRLLQRAESWAKERGYSELALDTAEPARHLIELYERRGYEHVGFVHWDGKRYRSVVMSKRLANAA